MRRYFCKKCGYIFKRHSLYAYYDSHGLRELRCKGCGSNVITFERAFEELFDKVSEVE